LGNLIALYNYKYKTRQTRQMWHVLAEHTWMQNSIIIFLMSVKFQTSVPDQSLDWGNIISSRKFHEWWFVQVSSQFTSHPIYVVIDAMTIICMCFQRTEHNGKAVYWWANSVWFKYFSRSTFYMHVIRISRSIWATS